MHAQKDFVAILASNGQGSCAVRHNGSRKRPFAAPACRPHGRSADDPPFGLAGQHLDHVRIQLRRLSIYRRVGEQGWIERSCVGHGIFPRC
jgi:hypothetical protein